ncbi:MAG: helix-turn-helix transcriptional regulator [Clostridia bacterium]|nr:helix-turn-helix transcriptional regulator [Clostridia bacterium]
MLSEKLREVRLSRGMSQVELAKQLGVTKQSVTNWENDNIQPSVDMLVKIAQCLSVSTDYLLELDTKTYIEVTGLTSREISHIQMIINDIKKRG